MWKQLIYISLLSAIAMPAFTQALKLNYGISTTIKRDEWFLHLPLSIGGGYEHNLNDRISIGLDYNINTGGLRIFDNLEGLSSENPNFSYPYKFQYGLSELTYTSKYFFESNDDAGGYFGTSVSMMTVTYKWQLGEDDYIQYLPSSYPADFVPGIYEKKITIFPITLRLGYRGSLDDAFSDFYYAVRLNVGNKLPSEKSFEFIDGIDVKKVSFVIGGSWGFGWAD
jgi:hypothetical protein